MASCPLYQSEMLLCVLCSLQEPPLPPFGQYETTITFSEKKIGGMHHSVLHLHKLTRKFRLVFPNTPHYGQLSFLQFTSKGVWCKEIVACHNLEGFAHVQHYLHPFILFRCSTMWLPSVNLSYSMCSLIWHHRLSIFCKLVGHVLSERTVPSE